MRATDVLRSALMGIVEEMGLNWPAKAAIEPPRDPKHGDLAANIAMLLAREAHKNPRELAQIFVEKLPQRKDRYVFRDESGTVVVEIEDETFGHLTVTPQTRIRLMGKVEWSSKRPNEVEVDGLAILDDMPQP